MHFSIKGFSLSLGLVLMSSISQSVFAQETPSSTPAPTPAAPAATPAATPAVTPVPAKTPKPDKNTPLVYTAEQVAESVILINGTRMQMAQVKRTLFERGKLAATYPDGSIDNATYEKRVIRGDTSDKDKVRLDQKYPSVEYAMVFNTKVFGLLDGAVFSPRQEAINSFESHLWHGIDALLRYNENKSKLELGEKVKHMGVEYYVVDVTDKENRKTRFFVSTKTLRILQLEYEMSGVKYRRKFYDYRVAQSMLVPYRTVLYANDKQVEETWVLTATYGQKVEESLFEEN